MISVYLGSIFLVVIATLGFITVYNQIDAGTKIRVAKLRSLSVLAQRLPQIIYMCALLVLLRVIDAGIHDWLYWVFINLQTVILVYSNLLAVSFGEFIAVQAIGVAMFASAGAMNWLTTPAYLLACLFVYGERWYAKRLPRQSLLYLVPPLIVGAFFWAVMYLGAWQISAVWAVVNFLGFAWAYFALWDYDRYQQRDQQVIAKLAHEVQYDGLTRARNWTMFQQDFNHAYSRVGEAPLTLVALDLDHFKNINDTHGHLVGNHALMLVSSTLQGYLHQQNAGFRFYRTGGEEFAIVLPGVDAAKAAGLVRECQRLLRNATVHYPAGVFHLSASFGVAQATVKDGNSTAVFKRADHYLYQSKRGGRDCITVEGQILAA